ncbi:MAG: S4 domain-containing protein, partial [Planctomycetota bacterium]
MRCYDDTRLDHYLMQNLAWKSRTRLQKLIREGVVTVNGEVSKPSRRVRLGDEIVLQLSSGEGVPDDYDDRDLPTVYEDPWLVECDEPR